LNGVCLYFAGGSTGADRRMMGSILNVMQHSKLDIQSTSFEFLNHILWLNNTLLLSDAKKVVLW